MGNQPDEDAAELSRKSIISMGYRRLLAIVNSSIANGYRSQASDYLINKDRRRIMGPEYRKRKGS